MRKYLTYLIVLSLTYFIGTLFPTFLDFYEIVLENKTNYIAKVNIMPEGEYNISFALSPKSIKKIKIYNEGESGYQINVDLNGETIKNSIYLENNKRQTLYIDESKIGEKK